MTKSALILVAILTAFATVTALPRRPSANCICRSFLCRTAGELPSGEDREARRKAAERKRQGQLASGVFDKQIDITGVSQHEVREIDEAELEDFDTGNIEYKYVNITDSRLGPVDQGFMLKVAMKLTENGDLGSTTLRALPRRPQQFCVCKDYACSRK